MPRELLDNAAGLDGRLRKTQGTDSGRNEGENLVCEQLELGKTGGGVWSGIFGSDGFACRRPCYFCRSFISKFQSSMTQTLHQFQAGYEDYARKNRFEQAPSELYEPINYVLGLGGKHLRPAALLTCCHLFDQAVEKALPAAHAVEIFHNFTLLHDDVMDAAPLRRGKPTVHVKYNLSTAILSGDVMLVKAYEYLLRLESPTLPHLLRLFTKTAVEVCEGQQMDMNFETRHDVRIEEYLKMIELKTSVLVACAMQIGALLGGASERDAERTYEFGRNLGIAFQLQDDLLDAFGDPKKFGKKVGGDIVQNKKTYLYLKALEQAPGETRQALLDWFSSPTQDETAKIAAVTGIFNRLKIRELTEELKEKYQAAALENLAAVQAPKERKAVLENFAALLLGREV